MSTAFTDAIVRALPTPVEAVDQFMHGRLAASCATKFCLAIP